MPKESWEGDQEKESASEAVKASHPGKGLQEQTGRREAIAIWQRSGRDGAAVDARPKARWRPDAEKL